MLELLAFAAAAVGRLDRFEQGDLGKDDIGFKLREPLQRAHRALEIGTVVGEVLAQAGDDPRVELVAGDHEFGH